MLRILSHVGRLEAITLPPEVAARVEIVPIPMEGELEEGLTGDVLLTSPTAAPTLADALSRGVRWVHLIGTGIDGFPIELIGPDCVLTNSRGLSAVPISEWVMACMLAFEKRLPEAWVDQAPERWNIPQRPLGTLAGKTLALLGLGGIGSAVAVRALPFRMHVKAMRRTDGPSPVEGVEMVRSPEELVAGADHVVIVAPLTDATRGIVDRDLFAAMAHGVHLVNVARGPMVVQDALRDALDDGTVAMASLDTTDPEPLPAGHWMYADPRIRISPHTSWNFPGAFPAMFEVFAENLARHLDGRPLLSVVDPPPATDVPSAVGDGVFPTPTDEGRHLASTAEQWTFTVGRGGLDRFLVVQLGLVAAEGRASFAAAVRLEPTYAVVLVAADLPMPRFGLEVRGPGIWADHNIEDPLDRWSLGLEAFGVGIDVEAGDDLEVLLATNGSPDLRGDRAPLGWDLEWTSIGPPVADPSGLGQGYRIECRVEGELLTGEGARELDGPGGADAPLVTALEGLPLRGRERHGWPRRPH